MCVCVRERERVCVREVLVIAEMLARSDIYVAGDTVRLSPTPSQRERV